MNFDEAFEKLIGHEGGFTDNPKDRGNWTGGRAGIGELRGTKYGISAMSYPRLDIRNLTLQQAKEIYRHDFWEQSGCELVPEDLKFDMFDIGVNSGPVTARKLLQRALRVVDDGVIGPKTLMAMQQLSTGILLCRLNAARIRHITSLDDERWMEFGRGLANRVATNLESF